MLPHVAGRPLTLVHCPCGLAAPCNYLRHAKAWGPSALRRVRIREKTRTGEYLVADNVEAIVSLAQMGIVEMHTWNSTDDDVERPNRIILDIDPGPEVSWKQVVGAARLVRNVFETLGLESWVKTTGGRGLHVVVPITPEREWSVCLGFARDVTAQRSSNPNERGALIAIDQRPSVSVLAGEAGPDARRTTSRQCRI